MSSRAKRWGTRIASVVRLVSSVETSRTCPPFAKASAYGLYSICAGYIDVRK